MSRVKIRLALLAEFVTLATLAGCARRTDPVPAAALIVPITVSREVAYAHAPETVRAAYTRAMDERGLRVDSASSGELRATFDPADSVSLVRVLIGPGAPLTTRVSISYRYLGGGDGFYHYPYQLAILAYRHLDRSLAVESIPQAIFPPGATSCPGATPVDSTPITEPEFATGSVPGRRIEYTEEARRAEVQGIVYLAAVVTEDGRVPCVEVLSGLPHGLTESAVRSLASATFTPARRGGKPIARRIVLPVRFLMVD